MQIFESKLLLKYQYPWYLVETFFTKYEPWSTYLCVLLPKLFRYNANCGLIWKCKIFQCRKYQNNVINAQTILKTPTLARTIDKIFNLCALLVATINCPASKIGQLRTYFNKNPLLFSMPKTNEKINTSCGAALWKI